MPRGRRRLSARGRSRAALLLLAAGVSCHMPVRGGPAPPATNGLAIRVNQLGYRPDAPKAAVACALEPQVIATHRAGEERDRTVRGPSAAETSGAFGPCASTYRLPLSRPRPPRLARLLARPRPPRPARPC